MTIQKIAKSQIKKAFDKSYDLFICSSSFEERCLSIANSISVNRISRSLIISNMDLIKYIRKNKIILENRFGKKGKNVEINTLDPILTADQLDYHLIQLNSENFINSILLDVTTFTHESLLILLQLLRLRCPNATITGIYANASEYSIGDDINHKWLSRGIGEVRSVLGFPGNILPSRKTHLILIVGYEYERAIGIIESLEPNSISLGYGRSESATTKKDKSANERYMHLVEQVAPSFLNVNCFEIPCDNPNGTFHAIKTQISKVKNMNIILAPMNNKLSTIGAAWVGFENKDVQICYAQALRYNYTNYSAPGNQYYLFDLSWKKKKII